MNLHGERAHFAPIIASCWSQVPAHRPELTVVAQKLLQLEGLDLDLSRAQELAGDEKSGSENA